jgi:glutamine synthetase
VFDQYLAPDSVKMFESMRVMNKKELEARNEIKWETYIKKIQIEARVFGDLSLNHIIPMATKYQSMLVDNVNKLRQIFPAERAAELSKNNMDLIEQISEHTNYISTNVKLLVENRKVANRIDDPRTKAVAYHDTVAPLMEDIRKHIDKLEEIVEDEMWTLPKYREMLFIQ